MNNALLTIQDVVHIYLHEPYASLLMGITYGVPIRISKQLADQIGKSGLTHLIVLSGANITALLFLVEALYSYIGKRIGLILYALFLCIFISIVGLEAPLLRALIMFVCACVCVLTGMPVYQLWNLWLSLFFIALLRPDLIYSRSLHLSLVATFGLIVGGRIIERTIHTKQVFIRDFFISLSVFITTLPLTCFYFRSISLISPIATVFASIFIPPVMVCGLLIPIAHMIFPPLAHLISIPTYMLLLAIASIIHYASLVPHSYWSW